MDNSEEMCNQEEMLLHIASLQDSQLMQTCLEATTANDMDLNCECWSNLDQDWVQANFNCYWSVDDEQTLLWTYQTACFTEPLECDWCDGGNIASDVIATEDQTCQQLYDDAMLWFAIDGQTCDAENASGYKMWFQTSGCCESSSTGAPTQTDGPIDTTENVMEMDCSVHQGDVEAYVSCLEQRIFRLEEEIQVGRNVANEMQTQCAMARETIGGMLGSCATNVEVPVVMG